MTKKTAKPKPKKAKPQPKDLVSEVVAQLKPELKNHIESLRSDILSDVTEMMKKNSVPTPNTSLDVNSLVSQLKDGNLDLSSITNMIPQATPQPIPKDLTPEQHMEYLKMQNQNQMLTALLPHVLKLIMPQQNEFVGQMMNRIFMEQMSSVVTNQRAQSMMIAKLVGSPDLLNQLNRNYEAMTKPLDQAIDKTALNPGAPGAPGAPNGQDPSQ